MEIGSINSAQGAVDVSRDFSAEKVVVSDTVSSAPAAGNSVEATKSEPIQLDGIAVTNREVTADFLQKTIDRVNRQMRGSNREFSFSVHEATGQFVIKVIDPETKEIVREIPPEKSLDAVAKMWDMMGIFVDKRIGEDSGNASR